MTTKGRRNPVRNPLWTTLKLFTSDIKGKLVRLVAAQKRMLQFSHKTWLKTYKIFIRYFNNKTKVFKYNYFIFLIVL